MKTGSIPPRWQSSMANDTLSAKLYLCATPIGNLEDITLRCLRVLRGAAAVYCEDTRNTLKLMNHFEIKKTLISCHEHNEEQRAHEIADRVRRGEAIAFVSDAGMPGVSDPGSRLVRFFVENDLPFEVLPGANAVLTAWVMSGLPTDALYFCGFLPRSGAERAEAIARIKNCSATAVLYESPHRVGATFTEFAEFFPQRECALVREITKSYEQVVRGTAAELAERYSQTEAKGECVIVISPCETRNKADDSKIRETILLLLKAGVGAKSTAKITADLLGVAKNEAYKIVLELST